MFCGQFGLQVGGVGAHFSSKLGGLRGHFGSKLEVLGIALAPNWGSWEVLGDLWPNMAPRGPQKRKYQQKNPNIFDALLEAKLEPKSTQVGTKIYPETFQKSVFFLLGFGVGFWTHWVPTWVHVGDQDGKKPKNHDMHLTLGFRDSNIELVSL